MTRRPTGRPTPPAGCPICGAPAAQDHRPFCSGRCADIDLGRWLRGTYAIPTDEPPDPGGASDAPQIGHPADIPGNDND